MKVPFYIILSGILLLFVSCQKMVVDERGKEIVFTAGYSVSTVPAASKASFFDNVSHLQDKSGLGGFFRVEAYKNMLVDNKNVSTSDKHFTSPTIVMYYTDVTQGVNPYWTFYNDGTNKLEERYWPQTYNLDFLAYMPLKRGDSNNKIHTDKVLDPLSYVKEGTYDNEGNDKGPVFVCENLPLAQDGQNGIKEFIYAWKPNTQKMFS